ncbi:hypothetical protein ABT083_35075 [Streptomyces goshikiensis]|uniref:hypothetical protein n=1 Tax=Streptomyces goshikiensis TaxID=1942 RepID=UPI0033199018
MTCVLSPPAVRGREGADPPPRAVGARRLLADPDAVDAVCAALSAVSGPAGAPVILVATDYTGFAADAFVARRDDGSARLRPCDSVALEPAGLLQRFIAVTGWRGPAYILGSRPEDGQAAVDLALAMVGSGRAPSVQVCEVLRHPDTGAFWAVATRVAPGRPPAPGPVPLPPGTGAALWERSAVARAYLRQITGAS